MSLPKDLFAVLSVSSRNFYFCRVHEKDGAVFDPQDKAALLSQMDRLLRDINNRWVGGCYYSEANLRGYHVVQKYVKAIYFAPCQGDAGRRPVHIEIEPGSHGDAGKAPKAA